MVTTAKALPSPEQVSQLRAFADARTEEALNRLRALPAGEDRQALLAIPSALQRAVAHLVDGLLKELALHPTGGPAADRWWRALERVTESWAGHSQWPLHPEPDTEPTVRRNRYGHRIYEDLGPGRGETLLWHELVALGCTPDLDELGHAVDRGEGEFCSLYGDRAITDHHRCPPGATLCTELWYQPPKDYRGGSFSGWHATKETIAYRDRRLPEIQQYLERLGYRTELLRRQLRDPQTLILVVHRLTPVPQRLPNPVIDPQMLVKLGLS
ncbi:hypothetical protein ABZ502_17485 [Streptomyces abikoensis]|uniref:hypothetical protein n=1 Tax=Streptomyces abikoensis TaxID=97398 RepID=UPI0033F073E1